MKKKKDNIRVLHIAYSDYLGGASRATYRIHKSIKKSKVNSKIFVKLKSKKKDSSIIEYKQNFIYDLFKISINKLISKIFNNGTSIASLNIFNSGLVNKINNDNCNIVHLHWINNETLSINEISKIKKRIVWTCHDMWPINGIYHYTFENLNKKHNFLNNFILDKKKKILKKKIFFIAVSKWLKNKINKSIFKNNHKIHINNPIDFNFWRPNQTYKSRKYLKLNNENTYLGVGNLEVNKFNRKGYDELIDAIKLLKNDEKNIEIIEFGNKEKIDFKDISIKVHNFGEIKSESKLRHIYNSLNVFILPSKLEAFGQVATEAIACGTPVAGFSNTGLDDIVINKKNGFLAKNFKSYNLANAIERCLKIRLNKFQIRSSILNKFSYEKISKEYVKLYRKILNEKD